MAFGDSAKCHSCLYASSHTDVRFLACMSLGEWANACRNPAKRLCLRSPLPFEKMKLKKRNTDGVVPHATY